MGANDYPALDLGLPTPGGGLQGRLLWIERRRGELLTLRPALAALAAEVAHGMGLVPHADSPWRSAAADEYKGRVAEVRHMMAHASTQLDEAVRRIPAELARLEAEHRSVQARIAAAEERMRSMAQLHALGGVAAAQGTQ